MDPEPRTFATAATVREILAEAPGFDPTWADDLQRMRAEDEAASIDAWRAEDELA